MRIVVVGGGISGLTAGYHLMRAGHDVQVMEPDARPGGVMRTLARDGFLCEIGPQSILEGSAETRALVEDLELKPQVVRPAAAARRRLVYVRGRLRAVPSDPLSLLSSDLLTAGGKWRLVREPFVKPLRESTHNDNAQDHDESVFDFGVRRLGPEAARVLVAPATIGIFAGDAAALSLRSAFPRLAALEDRHGSLLRGLRAARREGASQAGIFSFREGLEALPRALAQRLGDRLVRAEVRSVARDAGGWLLTTADPASASIRADAVMLATPPPVTSRLLASLHPQASRLIADIPVAPVAVVWFGFREKLVGLNLDAYGFLVARGEGPKILGCQYESAVFPGRAPGNGVLLRVILGGTFEPGVVDESDTALTERARHDLETVLGIGRPPDFSAVWRHPHAIPQYQLGHSRIVESVDRALETLPGLKVLGTALRGIGVNDCIRNAAVVARTMGRG